MRRYYSLVTVGTSATLNIYGDIVSYKAVDSDVTAFNLSQELDAMENVSAIDVYINSYGGEVKEGLAIYNALKRKGEHCKVTTYCDGFACSIASVIFMAGTERVMSKASLLMIHNAWTLAAGNAEELRKQADDLDIITGASVEAYKERTKIGQNKLHKLMDAETWITPSKAVEYGFATSIVEEQSHGISQSGRAFVYDSLIRYQDALQRVLGAELDKCKGDDENASTGDIEPSEAMRKWKCTECGYIMEKDGDPEGEECPECGATTWEEATDDDADDTPDDDTEDETNTNEETAEQKMFGFFNAIRLI